MDFLLLFWEYFKIGLFTIGGGYAMIPLVTPMVEKHGWMTELEIVSFIGVAEATPGPFAINLATFIGVKVGGATTLGVFGSILGAFIATFAVVLPSFIIIMVVTKLFDKFKTNKYVQYVLYGIKPIVVGLLLSAVLSILCKVVLPNLKLTAITKDGFSQFNWISLLIVCAFFPLSRVKIKGKRVHPIILIILSAVIGVVVFGAFGVTQ